MCFKLCTYVGVQAKTCSQGKIVILRNTSKSFLWIHLRLSRKRIRQEICDLDMMSSRTRASVRYLFRADTTKNENIADKV